MAWDCLISFVKAGPPHDRSRSNVCRSKKKHVKFLTRWNRAPAGWHDRVSCEKLRQWRIASIQLSASYAIEQLITANKMIKPSQKVVIVGAGPGGLAAAMLLARSGVNVTVVERRDVVGGRTSTIERSGFKFDTGPTFFLYPKVLREIFSVAGRNLDEEIPMYRLDPQYLSLIHI